jgi:translation initiation factor 1 (eIF-1/SUI1)
VAGRSTTASAARLSAGKAQVPERVVAKLRMEKKERGGKTVAVIFGLPNNDFLKNLCDLKKACGWRLDDRGRGGIAGELRDRVRAHRKEGFVVKG